MRLQAVSESECNLNDYLLEERRSVCDGLFISMLINCTVLNMRV